MKILAVVGCAPCWENDFNEFTKFVDSADVMAIGLDCPYGGRVKYFCTYHWLDIKLYKQNRINAKVNTDFEVICHKKKSDVDIVEEHIAPSGSSSLLGVAAAIKLKYNKIVLIGCPMNGANKNGHKPYDSFQEGWVARLNEIKDCTRSMSGWTKELLGAPTKEWFIK